jgi:predicted dehydrogenase
VDENGQAYKCTAEDAAYSTFKLEGDIIAHFNSSWTTRVRRDDLLTVHVDGTQGSAVAGLRKCFMQSYANTPRPVWNPDVEQSIKFLENWVEVGAGEEYDNAFKVQWELFLKHVMGDEPFPWNLMEGARGIQLAEKGLESWDKRRWMDIPNLDHTEL